MDPKSKFISEKAKWLSRASERRSKYLPGIDRAYCVSKENLKGAEKIHKNLDVLKPFDEISPQILADLKIVEKATAVPQETLDHLSSMACMMDFLQDPDASTAIIFENGAAMQGDEGDLSEAIEKAVKSNQNMVYLGNAAYVLNKKAAEDIVSKSMPINLAPEKLIASIAHPQTYDRSLVSKRIYTEKMTEEPSINTKPSFYIPIIVFVVLFLGFGLLYIIDLRRDRRIRGDVNSSAALI